VDGEVYKTVSTKDKSEIKIPKNPEKEGYEFIGWFLENGDKFTANSLLDTPISDDMVLKVYAKFNPVTEEDSDFLFKACDGGYAVIGYTGDNPIVTIPSTYKDQPVVAIDRDYGNKDGFAGNEKIQEVIIPNTVTKISSYAFKNCINLTTVTIPDSVTEMDYAFAGCEKISVATLPATLLEYFPKQNLTTVVINSGTSIPNGGFYNCKNLISVTIPDSITSIGTGAFRGCESLTTIRLPSGITEIPASTFSNCINLKSITIPESVTKIGDGAFFGCINLNNLTIPDNIKEIEKNAFYNCKKFTSITIPNEVSEIGYDAFGGCDNITSVTAPAFALSSISKNSLSTVVITGGEEIPAAAFNGCQTLKEVTLPDSIKRIGSEAFYGCTNLKSTTLPQNLTAIEDHAFYECSSLTSITLPDSVTSIGKCAFFGCTRLSKVVFQNTSGWGCIEYSWQTKPTTISRSSLSNSNTAAICLTETYVFADWTRN
jgi:uncharacterized repeat protein (TIGR02543 family)